MKQLKIVQLERLIFFLENIFFDILEIFRDAVFLLIDPFLEVFISTDCKLLNNFFALFKSLDFIAFSISVIALLYFPILILLM